MKKLKSLFDSTTVKRCRNNENARLKKHILSQNSFKSLGRNNRKLSTKNGIEFNFLQQRKPTVHAIGSNKSKGYAFTSISQNPKIHERYNAIGVEFMCFSLKLLCKFIDILFACKFISSKIVTWFKINLVCSEQTKTKLFQKIYSSPLQYE